ncbi:serine hydrolase [Anaeroselena agilis]|uniref:Serine hydrolase n=1 Tax=Anaeroselena agilis TaxID=3063788 RepID=A0ABU3NU29_9FIRM|nr:serine hydrolase [Selenomonadales bacterium 4137-cl]
MITKIEMKRKRLLLLSMAFVFYIAASTALSNPLSPAMKNQTNDYIQASLHQPEAPTLSKPFPESQYTPQSTPASDFDGTVGFFAKNLKTGQTIGYNQTLIFPTASTSKLAVALATYKYLYPYADAAAKNRYDEAIDRMMRISDNESFYELLDEIDARSCQPLSRLVTDLGLMQTKIHNSESFQQYQYSSVTTPYEMAALFERIYRDTFLDREKSETLKIALANTIFNDELPRFLPGTVMHKIGELDDILCDVGVVDDGESQILISIYTRTDQGSDYASDFIASLAARLYNDLRSGKPCC